MQNPRGACSRFFKRVPPGSHIVRPSIEKSEPWTHAIYIGGHRVIHGDSSEMKVDHVNEFVSSTNAISIIEYDEDGQWPRAATTRAIKYMKAMPHRPQRIVTNVPILCRAGVVRYDEACERVDVLLKQNEVRLPKNRDRIILSTPDRAATPPRGLACSIHAKHVKSNGNPLSQRPTNLVVDTQRKSKFC